MKTDVKQIASDLMDALAAHRPQEPDDHWATIETFCAVALRVMSKTNPSKIASEARTVEISTLISRG